VNEDLCERLSLLSLELTSERRAVLKFKLEREQASADCLAAKAQLEIFRNDNDGLLFVQRMM
jgi:hypothetical protein